MSTGVPPQTTNKQTLAVVDKITSVTLWTVDCVCVCASAQIQRDFIQQTFLLLLSRIFTKTFFRVASDFRFLLQSEDTLRRHVGNQNWYTHLQSQHATWFQIDQVIIFKVKTCRNMNLIYQYICCKKCTCHVFPKLKCVCNGGGSTVLLFYY